MECKYNNYDHIQTLVEGEEEYQPQRGDLCRINLVGRLENGTVVEELNNHLIQIGDVEVVQGLDMAIPLMRVGAKAEVACDPRFAYGTLGLENKDDAAKSIPAGAKVKLNESFGSNIFMLVYDKFSISTQIRIYACRLFI